MRLAAAVLALALAEPAEAASCRGYGQAIVGSLKPQVEALRMVEREAADRIVGLDTRPYDHLLGQARAVLTVISDKRGLDEEDALSRCRNYIAPVRRTCMAAAEALVVVLGELAGGAVNRASKDVYATAMAPCEQFMSLAPLKTTLRG